MKDEKAPEQKEITDAAVEGHAASVVAKMHQTQAEAERLRRVMEFAREVGFFEMLNQSGNVF